MYTKMKHKEIRKHKENQPQRICYYDNCPLHDDYNLKYKSKSEGPFTQCDASLCEVILKINRSK